MRSERSILLGIGGGQDHIPRLQTPQIGIEEKSTRKMIETKEGTKAHIRVDDALVRDLRLEKDQGIIDVLGLDHLQGNVEDQEHLKGIGSEVVQEIDEDA